MAGVIKLPTRSIGLKFLLVVGLALLMAIPTIFVYGVMKDRLSRFETVRGDISHYQGGQQSVLGPVLLVPYTKQVQTTSSDNKVQLTNVRGEAVVFAETGLVDARLKGSQLHRGIYSVPV